MNVSRLLLSLLFIISCAQSSLNAQTKIAPGAKSISIAIASASNNRINFGVEKLSDALTDAGYTVHKISANKINSSIKDLIVVGKENDVLLNKDTGLLNINLKTKPGKEGFSIKSGKNNNIIIAGADNSGALYGCM
jgi:hypothetical protein